MAVFEGSLEEFEEIQSELTAAFEVAMAEARREISCQISEIQWYSVAAKGQEEIADNLEPLPKS